MPWHMLSDIVLYMCLLIVATGFAAIGHGGASGYTAVLLLAEFSPEHIRPIVLCMNIVVTLWVIFTLRQTFFDRLSFLRLFVPLMVLSIPAAFIGGAMNIDSSIYRMIIAALLFCSAVRLLFSFKPSPNIHVPHTGLVLILGALLGWLSGLTGIGGGVLLSPLLLLLGWSDIRRSIPIVAGFILFNSIAGLSGYLFQHEDAIAAIKQLPYSMLAPALLGAIIGTFWVKHQARSKTLTYLLALILALASVKMFYTGWLNI